MFLKYKNEKIVNLKNVSNIFIREDRLNESTRENTPNTSNTPDTAKKKICKKDCKTGTCTGSKTPETSGKVIFNMNYPIKIFDDKVTADYIYFPFKNQEELQSIKELLIPKLNSMNCWIFPFEEGQRFININAISSISKDDNKKRVIFNLNYPISFPKVSKVSKVSKSSKNKGNKDNKDNKDNKGKRTSDFVFFNFTESSKYNKFLEFLNSLIH